ncbi:MAG: hypothetical protein P1V51_05380 [Deltaproteobacteria bacterium]|nr:hypothetical protein [Deltaproteobacteria bacterium]
MMALVVAASGCAAGETLDGVTRLLEVEPGSLDFPATAVGGQHVAGLKLRSVGSGTLELTSLRIEGAETFVLLPLAGDELPLPLESGRELELRVAFVPVAEETSEAVLLLETDASGEPLKVSLRGLGRSPLLELCEAIPEVETPRCFAPGETPTLDFGEVIRGRTAVRDLLVRNLGAAELLIFDEKTGLSPEAEAAGFESRVSLAGGALPPGASVLLPLTFSGREQGEAAGELILFTNDLEVPLARVELRGLAPVNATPQACAAIAGIEHLDGSAALASDGALPAPRPGDRLFLTAHPGAGCSRDAEDGEVLSYQWRLLSRPTTSAAVLENDLAGPAPGTSSAAPWLQVDAVGSYQIELVVLDGLGDASAPALLELQALPADDLVVELAWSAPVDLDAHLIAPGGTPFCAPLDCFWDTCLPAADGSSGLDWGEDLDGDGRIEADGDPATDPLLGLDDDGQSGLANARRLETLHLPRAALVGGAPYAVGVHFFRNEAGHAARFEAVVKVLYRGQTLLESRRTFEPAEVGTYWRAGEVDLAALSGNASTDTSIEAYSGAIACP